MQRQKGKAGEREVAAQVRAAMPWLADRVRRGWQAREGDDDPDVIGIPGVWLEVKRGRQPNPRAALAQAVEDSHGRGIPIAVVRDDRKDAFAVMRWTDLLAILADYMKEKHGRGYAAGTSEGVTEQRAPPTGAPGDRT
jgi:hypothetical protein